MAVALQRRRLTVDDFHRMAESGSEVYPDVMLLRPRDGGYPSIPEPDDVVLLIEVSDTSLAFDRGVKAGRYAAAGVPEYWVVDVAGACVWTMSHPGPGGYGDVHRHGDGALMAKGVPVEIAALF